MASLKESIPVWDMTEWDTTKEPERGGGDGDGGLLKLHYCYGTDTDEGNPSTGSGFQSIVPSVSSSLITIPEAPETEPQISYKTYDFMHGDIEEDYILMDGELFEGHYAVKSDMNGSSNHKRYIISDGMRRVMKHYFRITHREKIAAIQNSNGSFALCPRGDSPESIIGCCRSRRHPGPFITCAFGESHEYGDDFFKVGVDTKPLPDFEATMRPPYFKEKKAKFFKQCKYCEILGFVHHRNPAQHYEDYVNTVTYNKHMNKTKVWQQHLADWKFILNSRDPQYEDITDKCGHYKPSPIIIHATRYSRVASVQRKKSGGTVLSRKRTSLVKRPPTPTHRKSATMSMSNSRPPSRNGRSNFQPMTQLYLRPTSSSEAKKATFKPEDADEIQEFIIQNTVSKKNEKLTEARQLNGTTDSTLSKMPSSTTKINKMAVMRPPSRMKEGMKVSMTKLIRLRQAQPRFPSASTKLFETRRARSNQEKMPMPHPHLPPQHALKMDAKYIPKLKPNISAKILRKQRSKSKEDTSVKKVKRMVAPTTSGKLIRNKVFKSGKTLKNKEQESEEGSYAKFRDQNGNFDTEKYRRSVLKMLAKHSASGARRERRKKETRSERQDQRSMDNVSALPKIKNQYRNVKSKTASNLPQWNKQKKKGKKGSGEEITLESLFGKTISKISNKHPNERYAGMIREKDDRYSVPSFDDMW